ncbi:MAG: FAD-dependent monooxygenase [Rhodospirillaceae bacterium]|nr:FAD-dependent monooxygenase [Rhodospirillaceae bacterium]
MRITIVGAGPAGLYFAYLMKRSHPGYAIRVIEQNPPDATFGFGVVLSGRALGFLAEGDSAAIARISDRMERWSDQHIVHRGTRLVVDGSSYAAITRIVLLQELQALCRSVDVALEFGHRIDGPALAADCDVLVGADGANSVIRDAHAEAFGTETVDLKNYFAWYGAKRSFPAHTLTFCATADGAFCAHHYRYAPAMSTFVAETDADTWERSGMAAMDEDARKRLTESVFADTLGGQPLVSNRSAWKRWRLVKNARWSHGNIVLLGDAMRSAHPSIGSGTRLAMEDSISLWRAFAAAGTDIAAAFAAYERERRPIREKLDRAAERSIDWYETMALKMRLAPYDFALDYLLRTGVMTLDRLRRESPRFVAEYEAAARPALARA